MLSKKESASSCVCCIVDFVDRADGGDGQTRAWFLTDATAIPPAPPPTKSLGRTTPTSHTATQGNIVFFHPRVFRPGFCLVLLFCFGGSRGRKAGRNGKSKAGRKKSAWLKNITIFTPTISGQPVPPTLTSGRPMYPNVGTKIKGGFAATHTARLQDSNSGIRSIQ
jgi:hypothetical protein